MLTIIFLNKITGGSIGGDLDMSGHSMKFLKFDRSESSAARVAELSLKFDKHGGRISGPTTFVCEVFVPLLPSYDNQATPKKYVDDEIAKIQPINTLNFVKKDGSIPMTGI